MLVGLPAFFALLLQLILCARALLLPLFPQLTAGRVVVA